LIIGQTCAEAVPVLQVSILPFWGEGSVASMVGNCLMFQ